MTPVNAGNAPQGRLVAFARLIALGVSRFGAVSDGELLRTKEPVPVSVPQKVNVRVPLLVMGLPVTQIGDVADAPTLVTVPPPPVLVAGG